MEGSGSVPLTTIDPEFGIQPPAPVIVTNLFPEILEGLLALLADLDEQEWQMQTVCPGWSVKDVAAHLLGVDLGNLSVRRDRWRDPWWESAGEDLPAALSQFNEGWVVAGRRLSPQLLRGLLAYAGDSMAGYFASLELSAMGASVSWAGPDPAPVWLDVAREYTERWVHQQQIRDALHRPGLNEPRYLAPVLATFVHALPVALANPPAMPGVALRLVITGNAGGQWLAIRGTDTWQLSQDSGQPAAATVTLDQENAWRAWTRGISRDQAREQTRFEGDLELAEAVLNMVSIIA